MRIAGMICVAVLTAALGAAPLLAQHEHGTAPSGGYHGDYMAELQAVSKKIVALAEAIPAETYSWRPAEGVRSVSEVLIHVAGANFMIGSQALDLEMPKGLSRDMEKTVTEKGEVIEMLKKSFAHLEPAEIKDASLDETIKLFGQDFSRRRAGLLLLEHAHEHLGQLIAYSRMNRIAPPWSQAAE